MRKYKFDAGEPPHIDVGKCASSDLFSRVNTALDYLQGFFFGLSA